MTRLLLSLSVALIAQVSVLAAPEDSLIERGDGLMARQRFKEASSTFREAVRVNPDSSKAHLKLGASLAAQDDYETAILEEKTALKLDPQAFLPHIVLGQIYANQGSTKNPSPNSKRPAA